MSSLQTRWYQRSHPPVNPPLDKMYPKRDSTRVANIRIFNGWWRESILAARWCGW
jgi:hypothetical protein